MGHQNYDYSMTTEWKGIYDAVTLAGEKIENWEHVLYPGDADFIKNLQKVDKFTDRKGGIFAAVLNVAKAADTYLEFTGFDKGTAYVNGYNLGHYWNSAGP